MQISQILIGCTFPTSTVLQANLSCPIKGPLMFDFRYVLLKEMNMLLTMKAEYDRLYIAFPSAERLEKVFYHTLAKPINNIRRNIW